MSIQFKTILVPVDFTINTEVAIKKAIELADLQGASIHLLHVLGQVKRRALSTAARLVHSDGMNLSYANELLKEWKDSIEELSPNIKVSLHVERSGSIHNCIVDMTESLKADLVVIGKRSHRSMFRIFNTIIPNKIAEETGCAVFTVKPGALHNKIRTIVVPVSDFMPEHKMEVIAALCKKSRIMVHLVTFANGETVPDDFSTSSLLQMYQWLKNSMHCTVEYAVLRGFNRPRAILNYAEKIHADILLLHPSTETKIGWMNRHISDVLPPHSRVQVLTIQPAI